MNKNIPSVTLPNGVNLPMIGFGTYSRNAEPGQFKQAVDWSIEAGYRHIDTATMYYNEIEIGESIAGMIQKGVVTRDELFVTTKLWNDKHARKDVIPTLKESLKKLKLDYVDLYLVHWPVSVNDKGEDANIDYLETWSGMEEAVELGLTKSIGVSNFNEAQLSRLLQNAKIKPVVNQFEVNPTLTERKLVEFCKENNVVPVAYTPLGLISDARPEFVGKDQIKTDQKLGEIAQKYNKSRAQIALRYLLSSPDINLDDINTKLQRGIVVIPKSFTKSRIEENINIFDFELTKEEMDVVESYNLNHRCVPAIKFKDFNNYPF